MEEEESTPDEDEVEAGIENAHVLPTVIVVCISNGVVSGGGILVGRYDEGSVGGGGYGCGEFAWGWSGVGVGGGCLGSSLGPLDAPKSEKEAHAEDDDENERKEGSSDEREV